MRSAPVLALGQMSDIGLQSAVAEIGRHYGDRVLAIALFGSRVGARARADSDWDLLLVLDGAVPLRRGLYQEWDDEVAPILETIRSGISPHFVHLPLAETPPSSLWLEVTLSHEILLDRTGVLESHLARVRSMIDRGQFERRAVHGVNYWRTVP